MRIGRIGLQLGHPANGVERAEVGDRPRRYRRASIGPPRERGGKSSPTLSMPTAAIPGFNWATPRTGWKAAHDFTALTGFDALQLGHPANGVERMNTTNTPAVGRMLQLGHPANGVESQPSSQDLYPFQAASIGPPRERGGKHLKQVVDAARAQELQLGHPANGVESPQDHGRAAGVQRLQLGHPANGVERGRTPRTTRRDRDCFNWATPRTGWKDQHPKHEGGRGRPALQLGHPANGVER